MDIKCIFGYLLIIWIFIIRYILYLLFINNLEIIISIIFYITFLSYYKYKDQTIYFINII